MATKAEQLRALRERGQGGARAEPKAKVLEKLRKVATLPAKRKPKQRK